MRMPRFLYSFVLVVPGVARTPSQPTPWPVLWSAPDHDAQISFLIQAANGGILLKVKNTGTITVHFDLTFGGLPAGTVLPPRTHLDPGARAYFSLPCQPSSVQVRTLRVGPVDEGDPLVP